MVNLCGNDGCTVRLIRSSPGYHVQRCAKCYRKGSYEAKPVVEHPVVPTCDHVGEPRCEAMSEEAMTLIIEKAVERSVEMAVDKMVDKVVEKLMIRLESTGKSTEKAKEVAKTPKYDALKEQINIQSIMDQIKGSMNLLKEL